MTANVFAVHTRQVPRPTLQHFGLKLEGFRGMLRHAAMRRVCPSSTCALSQKSVRGAGLPLARLHFLTPFRTFHGGPSLRWPAAGYAATSPVGQRRWSSAMPGGCLENYLQLKASGEIQEDPPPGSVHEDARRPREGLDELFPQDAGLLLRNLLIYYISLLW